MTPPPPAIPPPKAILFDMGGVLLASPLHAIAAYEHENGIPAGWINCAISFAGRRGSSGSENQNVSENENGSESKSKGSERRKKRKDGAWQRLERGELTLRNPQSMQIFLDEFAADLRDEDAWREFLSREQQRRRRRSRSREDGVDSAARYRTGSMDTSPSLPNQNPPPINPHTLLSTILSGSSHYDPHMHRALHALHSSKRFLLLAGLSNTVIPPESTSNPIPIPRSPVVGRWVVVVPNKSTLNRQLRI